MSKGSLPSLGTIKDWMKIIARENGIPQEVESTWKHSRVNWLYADALAKALVKNGTDVDRELLKTACFIHDIGRMQTGSRASAELMHPINHAFIGYRLVKKKGYSERLARMCIVHMGGSGLDAKTNIQHGFQAKDYFPKTIEEKLLAYADARNAWDRKRGPHIGSFWKAYNRFKRYQGVERLRATHYELKILTENRLEKLIPKV